MSTTATPTAPAAAVQNAGNSISLRTRRTLEAAVAIVALGAFGALAAGANFAFNLPIWLLFTALWTILLAALALRRPAVDDAIASVRATPLLVQALLWVLFLPIAIGLWIWRRTWAAPVRLVLVVAFAAWNVFLFFPR
jgi:ABC-type amino acid transport system permease subunit